MINPDALRIAVAGDILSLTEPRSVLAKNFIPIKEAVALKTISTSEQSLTELGRNPSKKVSHELVLH